VSDLVGVEHGDPSVSGVEGSMVFKDSDRFVHRLTAGTQEFGNGRLGQPDLSEPILLGQEKVGHLLTDGSVHEA
jgi:hypothetical protein